MQPGAASRPTGLKLSTDAKGYWQRRLTRRRILQGTAVSSAGLAAATLIGCGRREAAEQAAISGQPKRGGTLTYLYDTSDAPHMDPHQQSFAALHETGLGIAYSRLMMYDLSKYPNELAFTGDVAEKYEIVEPTVWTFTLRQGVRFHNIPPVNGRELVASDVVFSYQRQIAERANAGVIAGIEKAEAVDKHTLRITLKRPDADFLYSVGDMRSKIVAPEAVEVRGDLKEGPTIGTGPWIFDQWNKEQYLRMRRNPDYFRSGLPYADIYERLSILDAQTAQAAFRTGQVINVPTNGQITKLLRATVPDMIVQDAKLLMATQWQSILAFPQGVLRDQRVRQALSKIIDREAIIRDVMFGSAWLNAGMYLPSFDWHLPEAEIKRLLARDLQAARQLLSAAGVDSATWKPELDVGIPTTDTRLTGELFVSNLREVGITPATVRLPDKVEVTERVWIRGESQLCVCNHRPAGGGVNGTLFTWYHSTGTDAAVWKQLGDRRMDELIERQAVMVTDPEGRQAVLQEIQRRTIDLAVSIPLYTSNGEHAFRSRVQGFKHHPYESHRFAEAWLTG